MQGSDALLIDGAQSQSIHLPVLQPQQNSVDRKAAFTLAADGTLTGTVEQQESGDIARDLRYLVAERTGKERQESLDHETAQDLQAFALSNVEVSHADDLSQPVQLHYGITAAHFAQPVGPLLAVRPRVLGHEAFFVDNKPRTLPINLRETQAVHDDFTIALPEGYEVDEVPAPVDLDLGFAAYHSHTSVEKQTLHYQRTYTVRDITLPAARYPDVQTLARTIAADEQSSAVLKHK